MKKRTFFATLLLFLVFFHTSLLIISLITLQDNISVIREKCLAEHYVIASGMIGDMQAVESRDGNIPDSLESLMSPYTRYSQNKNTHLAVTYKGQWIYKGGIELDEADTLVLAEQTKNTERTISIWRKSKPEICIYGCFPAPFQDYGLLYICNLNDMISSWRSMKNFLFFIGIVVAVILSVCLFYLLEVIFQPLQKITEASYTIASGDYHSRLTIKGQDEIADMAGSFNRMAEKVEEHVTKLQVVAEQKQQFVNNFAHELRTPLTAVYGYAEYIQKASITEKDKYDSTQFIMKECKRLQNMAYQLLDLATLRSDEIPMEECEVNKLFSSSNETMQAKAAAKGVTLRYCISFDKIVGNLDLLLILINNLIDNAIKASSAQGTILVSASREKGRKVLTVRDNGRGMNKEQLIRIKEAFYRVDKARSREAGGAGLGLAICEQIAQVHGALLEFSSQPEKGTIACVKFTTP